MITPEQDLENYMQGMRENDTEKCLRIERRIAMYGASPPEVIEALRQEDYSDDD